MKLYFMTYSTESGDHGVQGLYKQAPTDGHIATIVRQEFPIEITEDGERMVWFDIHEIDTDQALDLPEPSEPIPSI